MMTGWQRQKLGDVCDKITDGSHFSPKTIDSGFPYITVRDINDDQIDFVNCKFISDKDYNELSRNGCRPQNGDVLFSKDGTVGKVSLVNYDREFVVLSSLAIIRPNKKLILPEYLKHLLKAPFFLNEAIGKKTGVAIRRIVLKNLKSIQVLFPSIAEQKRIVAILDEVFADIERAKANAEQNLKNTRELLASYLDEEFIKEGKNWEEKKLEDIANIFAGGDVDINRLSEVKNDTYQVPIFTNGEKNKGLYGYTDVARVFEPSITISARGTIGYCEIRHEPFYPAIRLIVVTPDQDLVDLSYLQYAIKRMNIVHSGTSIPQLTVPMIKNYMLPLPPLEIQVTLAQKADRLSKETLRLEAIYQQKLDALEELKKAILQKAFAGELAAEITASNVIPFPGVTPDELHIGSIAYTYRKHEGTDNLNTFRRTKSEKINHIIEYETGLDMGRRATPMPYGPYDKEARERVEAQAKAANYFECREAGRGVGIIRLENFDLIAKRAEEAFRDKKAEVDRIIDLFLPMNHKEAEISATVYAAWNNLLIDGEEINDDKIVSAAREEWHIKKTEIPKPKFINAIRWLEKNNLVPKGQGKRVGDKPLL